MNKIVFGPVPSRRLGQSLGVNNIPPKICTLTCVYCQLGNTIKLQIERNSFYQPQEIVEAVREKVQQVRTSGSTIDYVTFVPDGEPTLDINLGQTIRLLKPLGIPIAVISNSTLVDVPEVRNTLQQADWLSLKMDTVDPRVWQKIDRPHGRLKFDKILNGARELSQNFEGTLVTETMLVKGLNDGKDILTQTARFVKSLDPKVAYISIPTRPPAEEWVEPPSVRDINRAYQIFKAYLPKVELLTGYEGNAFTFTGEVEKALLSIVAVHPMREDAVREFLKKAQADWSLVDTLLETKRLLKTEFEGRYFYMLNFRPKED